MQRFPATADDRDAFGRTLTDGSNGALSNGDVLSVLLIEDNPADARLFEEHLRDSRANAELHHEECLEKGLRVLHERRPDVLVLDLGLPDSEGPETVETAVAAASSVPVVVLTGRDDLEAALAAQEAGASDYLQKGEVTPELAARTLQWAARQAQMEAKLSHRGMMVRSIAENVSGGIFRTGPTGRIQYANQAFATLLGYGSPQEVLGVDLTTLYVNPEERGRMMAEEGVDSAEVEFRRRDGSVFVALLSAKATYDERGRMRRYDGIVTDITERKEVRERLKRRETLTRSILDAIAANIAVLDGEGTIIDVNEQWRRFARENGEEDMDRVGIGANYLDACTPLVEAGNEEVRTIREGLRDVIEERRDYFEHEYPCHSPEEKRWFVVRAAPLGFEGGGAVVSHNNITGRKDAERNLRDGRDRFATLFDSLPTPVLHGEVREDRGETITILNVNTAFEAVFGYDADRIRGEDVRELIVPADRHGEAVEINRQALEEETLQTEVERLTVDGARDFRLQVATRDQTDGPTEVYAIYTDITEQKRRERELENAKVEAEEAADLKSAMLANMSHEVRTPLTSITGFTEILSDELDGQLGNYAEKAHQSSERLMKTLTSVLEMSRLEAGAVVLDREKVSLSQAVKEAADLFEPEADRERITLDADLTDRPVTGVLNEDAVRRILENLVENAIKFTPPGGRVTLRLRRDGETAVLTVEDTGVGIGEEALPKIFKAFKQESEGLSREYEGTGLGLSIVKKLTEVLGGEIAVDSQKGEGTCFTVRLPLTVENEEPPTTSDSNSTSQP